MNHFKTYRFLILAIVFGFLALNSYKQTDNLIAPKIEASFLNKEALISEFLKSKTNWTDSEKLNVLKENGIYIYKYKNSQLKNWSSNAVPVSKILDKYAYSEHIILLGNTYYKVIKTEKGSVFNLALIEIKTEYSFENEYLQNNFHPSFSLKSDANILLNKRKGYEDVKTEKGDYLFSVKKTADKKSNFWFLTSYFLAWLCLILFFGKVITQNAINNKVLYTALLSLVFIAIRLAVLYSPINIAISNIELFSPLIHATSSLFCSLGDFIINVLILFVLINALIKLKITAYINYTMPFFIFGVTGLLYSLCGSLISNSNFPIGLSSILNFNGYSVISVVLLAFIFISQYQLIFYLYKVAENWSLKLTVPIFLVSITCAGLILNYFFGSYFPYSILLNILILILLSASKVTFIDKLKFLPLIILVCLLSLFSAYLLHSKSFKKELFEREQMAKELSGDNNYLVDFLFKEVLNNMKTDAEVEALLSDSLCSNSEIEELIKKKHFDSFWNNYNVQVKISHNLNNYVDDNKFDYNENLKIGLYNLSINISGFEFQNQGFSELLLRKTNKDYLEKGYSYAKYYKGKLVFKTGVFDYDKLAFNPKNQKNYETRTDDYNHSFYFEPDSTVIVISTKNKNWYDYLSSFAYLFLLYLFVMGLILVETLTLKQLTFKNKVQVGFILILVFSFIVIGGSTLYNTTLNYEANVQYDLKEKTKSVKAELENRLQFSDRLSSQISFSSSFTLARLPELFGLDINIYDKNGFLISTSKEQLFENKIITGLMNRDALNAFEIDNQNQFIHTENFGALKFSSAYMPFYNARKDLLGYLNIPYFSNQYKLREEIFVFIGKLINVYLILIVISIIIIIILSKQITKPLDLITKKLKTLQLGSKNIPIEWHSNDEIGELVKEYNNMVAQLDVSAKKLADSERESAWKDMAKQVAHEIKNPLTPMKLNVQHMDRLLKSDSPDIKERFDNFTKIMIEQIDALSNIASEFSNFATMPATKPEKLNINELIQNSVTLFEQDGIKIKTKLFCADLIILADKDQFLRLFNNLIKNAIQAIDKKELGLITIKTDQINNTAVITFKDNGSGMSEKVKENLFTPNFTTKTTGMGLGLAMVKRIILNAGGSIRFESKINKGTTFYIELPLLNNN